MFSPFDSIDDKIEKLTEKLKKLETLIGDESYVIYFTPTSVKRYVELVIKKQTEKKSYYFPVNEKDFDRYFNKIDPHFNYKLLKYNPSSNLEIISKIIANQGISGYSYLENIERVINLNKPTLMFYGIEQISAFFRNLYFNFTDENTEYNPIKRRFQRHGINSSDFKNIDIEISLDDLLEKKIQLKLEGFCPLFFLIFLSDHRSTLIDLFIDEAEISLGELLRNFFYLRYEHIPGLIRSKFEESFGKERPKIHLDSIVLTIYLIIFLFSHISRYKMHTWISLIESNERNISYYIDFIMKYGRVIFIKLLFKRLFFNEMGIGGTLHDSLLS